MDTIKKYLPLALRIIIAVILIQTLRFKFTGHPDSVNIFTQVGMEPYGRIMIGCFELLAGILILIPKTVWAGASLAAALMASAIVMHLAVLGIEVNEDKGTLFITAVVLLVLSLIVLWQYRKDIPFILRAS